MKIESGIPVPKNKTSKSKYPFAEMRVGDSFFLEGNPGAQQSVLGSASSFYTKRHPGMKFTVRREEMGARIWRIA